MPQKESDSEEFDDDQDLDDKNVIKDLVKQLRYFISQSIHSLKEIEIFQDGSDDSGDSDDELVINKDQSKS